MASSSVHAGLHSHCKNNKTNLVPFGIGSNCGENTGKGDRAHVKPRICDTARIEIAEYSLKGGRGGEEREKGRMLPNRQAYRYDNRSR